MIICKNVSYGYAKSKKVLKNVNLNLAKGKIGALLGVTGSGKTTLLKCIGNKITDYKGTIKTDDNCRYITQLPTFSNNLTGLEYVDILLSIGKNKTGELVNKIIDTIGIREDLKQKLSDISLFTNNVLILLSSLCLDSDTLIVDEPFKGLDRKSQLLIIDLLKILKEEGKTVLYSTDLLYYGYNIADELFILNKGKIVNKLNSYSNELEYERNVLSVLIN